MTTERLARKLANKGVAWVVVLVVAIMSLLSAWQAAEVDQDDDLLAFLPRNNPEVATFYAVNKRFGGLDVAIVGIAVDEPFEAVFLGDLKQVTTKLNDHPAIGYALSLSNFEHFTVDEAKGGIRPEYLGGTPPRNEEERAALRAKVMALDHVVGQVISRDENAVIIYSFLAPDADPRETAGFIRSAVNESFPSHKKYWGGAPFVSTYIYDITQADMARLIPWAVIVILIIALLSFRDFIGSLLALGSTGLGILMAHGLMGACGVNANIVLSSMPVILFAVGGAYGVHVLVRYYALRQTRSCEEAVVETLTQIGPTVLAAGLTTVAGLFSFLMMDIEPMRDFGLFTGLGILTTLILSLTFIPAVIRLTELKSKRVGESIFLRALVPLVVFARTKRWMVGAALAAVVVAGAALAGRVDARMETEAFFDAGSSPHEAESFLRDQFGGSQFIQVMVEGDMDDPSALREVQRLGDALRLEQHVSSVMHIGEVLSLVYAALNGERRIPEDEDSVALAYAFLKGKAAVNQLVTSDHKQALIHIKVSTGRFEDVAALLARVEEYVSGSTVTSYRVVRLKPVGLANQDPATAVDPRPTSPAKALPSEHRKPASDGDDPFGDAEFDDDFGDDPVPPRATAEVAGDAALDDADWDEGFGGAAAPGPSAPAVASARSGGDEGFDDEPAAAPQPTAEPIAVASRATPQTEDEKRAQAHIDDQVALRVLSRLRSGGVIVGPAATELLKSRFRTDVKAPRAVIRDELAQFLQSDESVLEPSEHRWAQPIADAVTQLGPHPEDRPLEDALVRTLDKPARSVFVRTLAKSLRTPTRDAWRRAEAAERADLALRAASITLPDGTVGERLRHDVADVLLGLDASVGSVTGGDKKLSYAVTGVPVLYRGLSKSVTSNQYRSLGFAFCLVLVIMIGLFRSPLSGMLAAAPTAATLLVVYGLMGAANMHLDIGTSMLASIIIGAGVDYAVHLLASWRADDGAPLLDAARHAAIHSGPAIWTNALMVAAGFFVLTLGQAKPLKNVGGLTAVAMIVAALATFLVLPVLARKRRYR